MESFVVIFARVWTDIVGGASGPMWFRIYLQPSVAAFFAVRAGMRDAREGRPPFFRALLTDPAQRHARIREAWGDVGSVFVAAAAVDVAYQIVVSRSVHPGEALMVAAILALAPYVVFRGLVNRALRSR